MAKRHTKKLLVEGKEDQAAIAYLLDAYLPGGWGDDRQTWPLMIEECDGVQNLLATGFIRTELKSSESRTLGIMVDADDVFLDHWRIVRNECIGIFPNIPEQLPGGGLIVTGANGNRLGVWIMPDNQSRGMLETFLAYIANDPPGEIWLFAIEASHEAQRKGAAYRDVHRDKAQIHTWLAWQDPPGKTLGSALRDRLLDPLSPKCTTFVAWFKQLYELP